MKENLSIKEVVYNGVLEDIFSYVYKPGEIITESSLMSKFDCSKTPVREALLSLCNDHVLRSIPRLGYQISNITMEEIVEMLQFRYNLENTFILDNISSFTPSQLRTLESIDALCSDAEKNVWDHWEYNTQFHIKMLSYCNNSYAVDALAQCFRRLKRAYAQFYWEISEGSTPSLDTRNHVEIIAAIRDKNVSNLSAYLKEDINDFGGIRIKQSEFSLI